MFTFSIKESRIYIVKENKKNYDSIIQGCPISRKIKKHREIIYISWKELNVGYSFLKESCNSECLKNEEIK